MGIEGVGNNQPQVQPQVPAEIVSEKMIGEAIAEVAPLFSPSGNLNVQETRGADKNEKTADLTEVPELDDADRALLERLVVDLEALLALLQTETDEAQVNSSKERIEALQGEMKQQHEATMANIKETLADLKDQYDSYVSQKVLGWLGVVAAIAMAVVACVFTGGVAAGFAVAGAVIALGLQVCNETGATEKLTKAIADSLKASGMSSQAAELLSQIIVAAIQLTLSLVGAVGGGVAAGFSKLSDAARIATIVASSVMQLAGMAASTAATVINYKATENQADLTELQAILKKLQAALDEESETLKELMQQLANGLSAVPEMLASMQDTNNMISMNISA